MTTTELALDLIRKHEGFSAVPYRDKFGKLTIGFGRNLDDNPISKEERTSYVDKFGKIPTGFLKDDTEPMSVEEAIVLLEYQVQKLESKLNLNETYKNLDSIAQVVILDMAYQLGYDGVLKFKQMWKALEKKNYSLAAEEMLNSDWAKQTPNRALDLSEIMKNGSL